MFKVNTLTELAKSGQLQGKRVFIRADLNVPIDDQGRITEDTRIRASVPGIRLALNAGAAVMVTSHFRCPKEGALTETDSLATVAQRLSELLGLQVDLVRDWLDGVCVDRGQVVLLENCRGNLGEKQNDKALARRMAALCDVYVNDAFGIAHRAEATTEGIARYAAVACAGPLLAAECDILGKALQDPKRPLVAIVGGSKVSTKLSILESLAMNVDQLIVGGGIANTFLLASGLPIGKSLFEPDLVVQARIVMDRMKARGAAVPIPSDVVTAKIFSANAATEIKSVVDVAPNDMVLDLGPNFSAQLSAILQGAGTIVWNGPMGVFEWEAFSHGTETVAHAIAASSAFSIVGGGDTLAAIAKFGIGDKVSYISTGGGAFLEFLEGKTLPALSVLIQRACA